MTNWKPRLLLGITALAVLTQFTLPSLRPGAAFLFLLLCPGAALIGLLGLKSAIADWTLSLALSLALVSLLAQVNIVAGVGTLETAFWLLVALSTIGFAAQLLRTRTYPAYRD